MTDDASTRGACLCPRIIRRTIVDHQNLVPTCGGLKIHDELPDGEPLVERRDDDRCLRGNINHVANRKLMMSPSSTMYSLPSRRISPCSRHAAIEPRAIS